MDDALWEWNLDTLLIECFVEMFADCGLRVEFMAEIARLGKKPEMDRRIREIYEKHFGSRIFEDQRMIMGHAEHD